MKIRIVGRVSSGDLGVRERVTTMKSKKITIAALDQRKKEGKKITVLTCYDYPSAPTVSIATKGEPVILFSGVTS